MRYLKDDKLFPEVKITERFWCVKFTSVLFSYSILGLCKEIDKVSRLLRLQKSDTYKTNPDRCRTD